MTNPLTQIGFAWSGCKPTEFHGSMPLRGRRRNRRWIFLLVNHQGLPAHLDLVALNRISGVLRVAFDVLQRTRGSRTGRFAVVARDRQNVAIAVTGEGAGFAGFPKAMDDRIVSFDRVVRSNRTAALTAQMWCFFGH